MKARAARRWRREAKLFGSHPDARPLRSVRQIRLWRIDHRASAGSTSNARDLAREGKLAVEISGIASKGVTITRKMDSKTKQAHQFAIFNSNAILADLAKAGVTIDMEGGAEKGPTASIRGKQVVVFGWATLAEYNERQLATAGKITIQFGAQQAERFLPTNLSNTSTAYVK